MKLFSKILFVALVLSLTIPVTGNAAFVIRNNAAVTHTISAAGNNNLAVADKNAAAFSDTRSAQKTHHTTLGRAIHEKWAHFKESFIAAPVKFWAILISICDLLANGGMGLCRFYMGYKTEGIMQLIFTLLGGVGVAILIAMAGLDLPTLIIPAVLLLLLGVISFIWQVIDLIRICVGTLKPRGGYWQ